ncbi:MAG: WGR domain-containing protein [Epibacterium sp.]|nr:WGR domain-containing protein [Epibacterium sp.]NQX75547.1 WGR domain-containing protein [Epibacterium sp.]
MNMRFEKYDYREGHHRYCMLCLSRTLFGDWCVERASGPIGTTGGSQKRYYFTSHSEAMQMFEATRDRQVKRGFVPIPVQMGLF